MLRRLSMILAFSLAVTACSGSEPTADSESWPSTSSSTSTPAASAANETASERPLRNPTTPLAASLALDSPEEAVQSLVYAYDDRDFVRAWLIFDKSAQQQLNRSLNNLQFSGFRRGTVLLPDNVIDGSGEHDLINDVSFLARFMEDAAHLGYLHVDLAGAEVMGSEDGAPTADGSPTSLVTVRLSDDSRALLRLTVTPTQRWRVAQIAVDDQPVGSDDQLFVDSTCGDRRVRTYPGIACPSAETPEAATVDAEIERLIAEAGDDINKQLLAAQEIQLLINQADIGSDDEICAALQGNTRLPDQAVTAELLSRAEALFNDTCPGSIDLLTSKPEVPPSGAVIGERTAYGQLDLSTPSASVVTFAELFENEAYTLLFLSLDADAQRLVGRAINNINVGTFVDPAVLDTWEGLGSSENLDGTVGLFSSFMSEATTADLHILDLSGPAEIVDSRQTIWVDRNGLEFEAHVVDARVGANDEALHFLLLESPSGRWRVRQVAQDPADLGTPERRDEVFIAAK